MFLDRCSVSKGKVLSFSAIIEVLKAKKEKYNFRRVIKDQGLQISL